MAKNSVREQVKEVVVRQALAGAPWREICDAPMKANGIHPSEIEAEVRLRKAKRVAFNPVSILVAVAALVGLFILFYTLIN